MKVLGAGLLRYTSGVRIGLIADIHANASALEVTLSALRREGVDEIVCLGDIVGYNAEPQECIDQLRAATERVVIGNHDWSVAHGEIASGTNAVAREAIAWTRANLGEEALAYLRGLPRQLIAEDRYIAIHGSFLNADHYHGYITGSVLLSNFEALLARPEWPRVAFCGHTHLPMCGWLEAQISHHNPLLRTVEWPASARVVLINPGSVGQPRDHDPRAAAAIIDLERRQVIPVRSDYDLERTAAAIRRAKLPSSLIDRLRMGW